MKKDAGMSLAELLVALFLSCCILTVLLQQWVGLKAYSLREQKKIAAALDMAMSLDVMRQEIRQAGFSPCGSISRLQGVDARTGEALAPPIRLLSKGMQISHMSSDFGVVSLSSKTLLLSPDPMHLLHDRLVLIADCQFAEVHTVQEVKKVEGLYHIRLKEPILSAYSEPLYLGEWQDVRFYLQHNQLMYRNRHVDSLSSLFRNMKIQLQGYKVSVWLTDLNGKKFLMKTAVRTP